MVLEELLEHAGTASANKEMTVADATERAIVETRDERAKPPLLDDVIA